jgi:metal-responsive CopG/Arc/MetJ family transcriptional regulator
VHAGKYVKGYTVMTKTTIDIDDDLLKKFSIIVIQKHGGRKKNDVITGLIKEYVEKNEKET